MSTGGPPKSAPRSAEKALQAIGTLFLPGDVIEIRALNVDRSPDRYGVIHSGYFVFEAAEEIRRALTSLRDRAEGIYVILNRLNPALLGRAHNRLQGKPKHTTSDSDIIELRWLYIDVDPVRPAGISSSDQEHEAALDRARRIKEFLSGLGWPEPIYADSGNGGHLLYRLPVLAIEEGKRLVILCLKALSARFSDATVMVDESTSNPARLCKLYGTTARKGDPMPDRPHRVARILEEPETLVPVAVEALEALASEISGGTAAAASGPCGRTQAGQRSETNSFDLQQWIQKSGLDVARSEPWNGGTRWILRACPWNSEHRNQSAYIVQLPSGAISAGCHHNGCRDRDWHALRDLVEPSWRDRRRAEVQGAAVGSAWDLPMPFDQFNLPAFPIDAFPNWLRDFISAEATATQTPVDLGAMLALSAVGAACAKKVRVDVREGYSEPLNVFTVSALPPGNRKSAVFAAIVQPLEDYERTEARRTAAEVAQRQTEHKIQESRLKRLQEQAVATTGDKTRALTAEAAELAAELAAVPVLVPTRCLADDCTPEKLAGLLRDQGGRIAVMSPEGDVFDLMAGRYSANGTANFGVYLKGHAGDAIRIDRVGRAPQFVDQPALTLGLAVQPDVIRGLAKPGFRGRGLLARFLYSLPASTLGYRDPNPPAVMAYTARAYSENLRSILSLPFKQTDQGAGPYLLRIDTPGQEILQKFSAWIEPQLHEFGELGRMTDWGGKIVGAVVRIAGILHMAEYGETGFPWDFAVSADTIERAIRIGRYLIPHAKAAFAEMGADEAVAKAKAILRWIEHERLDSFSRRDVHQGMRGMFKRAAETEPPLAILLERCFIRRQPEAGTGAAGRPASPRYEVNPRWARSADVGSHPSSNFEDCEYFEKACENGPDRAVKIA